MARIGAPKAGEALKGALGHVVRILEGKKFGDQIHVSDWKAWLPALTAVVQAVGDAKVEGGAAAIHRTAVRGIFGGTWAVLYGTRVPMHPWEPRLELAEAICEAVLALGQAEGRAALEDLKNAKPDPRDTKHAGVVAAAEAALAKLAD
jgi:hypothetical protein